MKTDNEPRSFRATLAKLRDESGHGRGVSTTTIDTTGQYGHHPDSLLSKAGRDPALRHSIRSGRIEYADDQRSMERWHQHGETSEPRSTWDRPRYEDEEE